MSVVDMLILNCKEAPGSFLRLRLRLATALRLISMESVRPHISGGRTTARTMSGRSSSHSHDRFIYLNKTWIPPERGTPSQLKNERPIGRGAAESILSTTGANFDPLSSTHERYTSILAFRESLGPGGPVVSSLHAVYLSLSLTWAQYFDDTNGI